MPEIGTAYVRVVGDFSSLNSQLVGILSPSKFKKAGLLAGGALAAGLTAAATGKALFEIGKEFDAAFDNIRTQTGATGKEFGQLKRDFRNVVGSLPTDFDTASKAVAGLNQRLDTTGKPLQRLTKQVVALSEVTGTDITENVEAVTRLFGDWSVKTKEQTDTLDGLFRLSQSTGTTVSDLARSLVQFGAPLRNLGIDLDFAAAMFANFEKSGVNMTTVLSGLRLSVGNLAQPTDELNQTLKQLGIDASDPEQALGEIFQQIKSLDDQASKSLAIQTFGKRAGPDLRDAVVTGRFALDDLIKTFEDGDGSIRESERATRDFDEQLKVFTNRLKLEVEPIAKDVFKGLSRLMKEVSQTLKREGFGGVINLLADKLREAVPKVLNVGAEIGAKLGKGLLEGFIDSAPIVKLLGLGWLVFKLSKVELLGRTVGKRFGRGLIIGALLALPLLIPDAIKWLKAHNDDIERIGAQIGEFIVNGLIDAVNVGIRAINEAFDALNVLSAVGVDAPELNEIGHVDFTEDEEAFKNLHKVGKREMTDLHKDAAHETKGLSTDVGANIKNANQKGQAELDRLEGKGSKHVEDLHKEVDRETGGLAKDVDKNTKRAAGSADKNLGDAETKGTRHGRELRDAFNASVRSMAQSVFKGFGNIGTNVQKATKALGLKKNVSFGLEAPTSSERQALLEVQRGGQVLPAFATGGLAGIVPGSGTGDRHVLSLNGAPIARVESKEGVFIGNRRLMAHMAEANRQVPRFARGGQIGGDVGGLNAGILGLVNKLYQRFGGSVSSGLRATDSGSLHSTGNAADYVPSDWVGASRAVNAIGSQLLEGIYNPGMFGGTPVSWDTGQRVDSSFWGAEWGNHLDHIHLATTGVAGAIVGAIKEIKRQILSGPEGPLRDAGQKALDRVTTAANNFLGRFSRATGDLGGDTTFPATAGGWHRIGATYEGLDGQQGAYGIVGGMGFAELLQAGANAGLHPNMSDVLGFPGDMPPHTRIAFRMPGAAKAAIAEKNDIGSGQPDLHYLVDIQTGLMNAIGWHPNQDVEVKRAQRGGLLDIGKLIRGLRGAGPGDVRELVSTARNRLTNRTAFDFLSKDGSEIAGKLLTISNKATDYFSNADNAQTLGGPYRGKTEIEWVRDGLDVLWKFRNQLLGNNSQVKNRLQRVRDMIKRLDGPKGIIQRVSRAIVNGNKRIEDLEDRREDLQDLLSGAKETREKSIKRMEAKLERERNKPRKERDNDYIAELQNMIRNGGKHKDEIRDRLAKNADKLHKARARVTKRTELRDNLRDKFLPALVGREGYLTTGQATLATYLETVQGRGSPMKIIKTLPPLPNEFGGDIFTNQVRLRELLAPPEDSSPTDNESAMLQRQLELTQQELAEQRQLRVVAESQLPVFDQFFNGRTFHTGGIVGGVGEQRVTALAGEGIFTEEQMAKMGGSNVYVIIEDDAIDRNKIRTVVGDELSNVADAASRVGGVKGQRGVMRR